MKLKKVATLFQKEYDFLGLDLEKVKNGYRLFGVIENDELPGEPIFVFITIYENFSSLTFTFEGFKNNKDQLIHINDFNDNTKLFYSVYLDQEENEDGDYDLVFDLNFPNLFADEENELFAMLDHYMQNFLSDYSIEDVKELISKLERV